MTQTADALIIPLLLAEREQQTEECLARLITDHAAPIIKGILRSKLRSHAGGDHSAEALEDLYGEVVVKLLARLRPIIANSDGSSITDFRGYVAVVTYNTC